MSTCNPHSCSDADDANSPPYFFTPNRFPELPRPFFVEPPPRFVAVRIWTKDAESKLCQTQNATVSTSRLRRIVPARRRVEEVVLTKDLRVFCAKS